MRKTGTIIILLLIVGLGFWLRAYKLTQSPPGLYLDESSNGYNAYSILKTGKDEHGVAWPLFFRSLGDYRGGVFIYSLIPLIKWHGLGIETIRLGAAIWGTVTILGLFWLTKIITNNNLLSLLSAGVLALMPWQIHFSRIGYEAITLPVAMELTFCCWLKWIKTNKFRWGLGLAIIFWVSIFTYQTAKLWIPLLAGLIIICQGLRKNNWQKLWPWLIGGELILLSFWLWEKSFPGTLMTRMNSLAIWRDQATLWEIIKRFSSNFINHWSWQFLFKTGDLTLRSSSRLSSEMLSSWSIFLLIGLVVAIKNLRKTPEWKIILMMLILFPLAAALTFTSPHAIRTLQAGPFFALIIALGIWWSIKKLSHKKGWMWIFIGLLIIVTGLEFGHYYQDLIYQYPKRVGMPQHGFDSELVQILPLAYEKSVQENKTLYLSDKIEEGYIQGLFFTQADPKLWQEKRQANFKVERVDDTLTSGIWILTQEECQNKQIKTDNYYCVIDN